MAVEANSTPNAAAPAAASPAPGRTGANAPAGDPGPTPSPSPASAEQDARGPDFFREAFQALRSRNQQTQDTSPPRNGRAPQAPPVSQPNGQKPERSAPSQRARRPASGNAQATTLPPSPGASAPQQHQPQPGRSEAISLTREQFDRRVQSEVDRLLAKREADERTRQAREEEQRLRDEDPFEYVRTVKQREAEQAQAQHRVKEATTLLEEQLTRYDRGILDPLVGALPEPVRKKVLDSVTAEGIPGRVEVAKATLGALRSLWQAEGRETARTALMKDQTFIKEILARYGGQANGNGHTSPEVVSGLPPASSARPRDSNGAVNDWMRSSSTAIRSTSGRR